MFHVKHFYEIKTPLRFLDCNGVFTAIYEKGVNADVISITLLCSWRNTNY
jgi:hypothetical protein